MFAAALNMERARSKVEDPSNVRIATRTTQQKASMNQPARPQPPKPAQTHPSPLREDPDKAKERAETDEVAGRHKNSGQKDHKGAR
jgi:hypothetical protein